MSGISNRVNFILKRNVKMIAIVELKRCIANTCILSIAVYKFCYRYKLYLVILLVIHKSTEIRFHCTVLSLGLSIYLWIRSSEELSLNIKEIAKQRPEFWDEQWALVTDYRLKKALVSYHYIDNNFYEANYIYHDHNWLIIDHLDKAINNKKNCIIVVTFPICWD